MSPKEKPPCDGRCIAADCGRSLKRQQPPMLRHRGWESCYNAGMIRVCIPQKKKEIELPGPKRVMDLVAETGMRPSTVIVTQGKKLLTKDQRVEDGETVNIISVVSGG